MSTTTTPDPLSTLRAARELISVPERWTQGELARGKSGRAVSPRGKAAVCWCAEGAISRYAPPYGDAWTPSIDALSSGLGEEAFAFNDTHTHAEVLALFDRTIARLSREAGR
jgi:hypothetical protein